MNKATEEGIRTEFFELRCTYKKDRVYYEMVGYLRAVLNLELMTTEEYAVALEELKRWRKTVGL